MQEPKSPREFSDTSDNPTNTGWVGQEKDWEEINLKHGFDEREDNEVDEWDNFSNDDMFD